MSKRRQNFAAHKGNVCCAAWGKKYGGLFATGGEDHVVNVWRLGAAHKLKSLDGLFNSAVTAVVFNTNETKLAAGTEGGTVRVYDFEHDKVLRTLNGHMTACTSLHFHPYASNYVVSTSKDNNLKVWDLRGKKCLNTFRGHEQPVLCSQFSPDGRLVATGGAGGVVKVWDLTSGKQMANLEGHRGPIADLCFHPFECVLASASGTDRTAKLWDMEDFSLIDTTKGITTAGFSSPKILFNNKGGDDEEEEEGKQASAAVGREDNEMICFGGAGLRAYCWEKGARGGASQVTCEWDSGPGTQIADVMPHPKKEGIYQACLINKTHVSIWRIDANAAKPLRPTTKTTTTTSSVPAESRSRRASSSPQQTRSRDTNSVDVRQATPRVVDAKLMSASDDDGDAAAGEYKDAAFDSDENNGAEAAQTPRTPTQSHRPATSARPRTTEQPLVRRPSSMRQGRLNSPVRRGSSSAGPAGFIPAHRSAPVGLNYASFLSANLTAYNQSEAAHKRAAAKIVGTYEQHMQAFETRLGIASKAAELWRSPDASIAGLLAYFSRSNGGPAGSSAVVLSPGQVDVFIAIFRRIRLRTSGLALKDLTALVPMLTEIARNTDRNDGYQLTAVLLLSQLINMFENVIVQTLRGAQTPAARRDVVFAERMEKVNAVLQTLETLNRVVDGLCTARGLIGFHARYLSKHLAAIFNAK